MKIYWTIVIIAAVVIVGAWIMLTVAEKRHDRRIDRENENDRQSRISH
jgi:uncharacterized alpha/beta hydrolase family protein